MKYLEINAEVESALIQVMDAALKSGGMNLLQHIDKIRNSIQFKPEVKEE